MASYVAAYRIGMLVSTAGVLYSWSRGFEDFGFAKSAAWTWGYLAMAAMVVDRDRHDARRDRAGEGGSDDPP